MNKDLSSCYVMSDTEDVLNDIIRLPFRSGSNTKPESILGE